MILPIQLSPLAPLPLEEVLLMMSMKEEEPQQANAAFREFHLRFKDYLFNYCQRSCKRLQGYYDNPELTVFDMAMNKVWFNAGKLLKLDGLNSEDDKFKIMKAWLSTTADRIIIDLYNENKVFNETHDLEGDDEVLTDLIEKWQDSETGECATTSEMELIRTAISLLKERDQHIYLACLALEEEHKYLPKEDVERLAKFYEITTDNLYHIRQRAWKKITEYIEQHTKPTGDGTLRYIPSGRKD
jgi:hypothetical protein